MVAAVAAIALALVRADAFPSDEDRREIAEILRIQRQFGDGVWPGFGKAKIPNVFYDKAFEYLIGHPSPPLEWTRVESGILPAKDLYRRIAQKPQGFAVKVGHVWCGSFATYGHMAERLKRGRDFHMAATLHEMFHAFQAGTEPQRFAKGMGVYALESKYPESDPELAKDWTKEGAILAEAMQAQTREQARDLARKFLEFRAERRMRAKLDAALIDFERQLEWLEGMGKYAEVRIIELASLDSRAKPHYDLSAAAARGVSDLFQLRVGLGIAKGDVRYYQSGMAQARLLDRLAPEWKKGDLGKLSMEAILEVSTRGQ